MRESTDQPKTPVALVQQLWPRRDDFGMILCYPRSFHEIQWKETRMFLDWVLSNICGPAGPQMLVSLIVKECSKGISLEPIPKSHVFPECVAKGSRFTFWGLGVETCSRDPACFWCPQPSAHVRGEGKVAVSMGKATKTCLSRRVRRCAHVVLRGRRYTLHSTLYTSHSTLHTLHFTLSTLYTPLFTLHTVHSTLCTPHFTLHTLHSTLRTLLSTSTIASVSLYMRFLYVICIRVRWFLLFSL